MGQQLGRALLQAKPGDAGEAGPKPGAVALMVGGGCWGG